jgi:ribosome biogenesis protein BRX1
MPGNCLKGSRPILSFDSAFEKEPHLRLIKECLTHSFGVPQGARRSKPFIDRVMGFSLLDGKIWVRNYEIREVEASRTGEQGESDRAPKPKIGGRDTDVSLVEIGPRFILTPILIQEGAYS